MASRWTFSFDAFENPERNDTGRHFSLYSRIVLGLLWNYVFISQTRFPRPKYSGISASGQSLGSKQLSQCKCVRPQYPFVFAPETAIFAKGKDASSWVVTHPEFYPASLLDSPTLEILLKSSEGCVLSSGMVKGEPCWQASVSSPPLIGEPYLHPLPLKGNHIGRHWYHPLPAFVLMSQVLLIQPRTEDWQSGRVLHLGFPSHRAILVPEWVGGE